ncbi:glycosyltransferase 87 family protein [Streptomyces chiangmaiensis]|uniref:Glycosyltransferase 87 family protein n=1 Tax=Streptomyces chiangmaiensis TaxID=766497 RepID=A0ABU7FHF2_9ACTN|nr:glycosyltransferase 87 family protein [Streptomyces chiangmaiensis]MED7823354.1 glycosyltransferase 87 family protein [Streptomyces chiangmaiensis]
MTSRAGWCLAASLAVHLLAVVHFSPEPLDLRVYRDGSPLVLSSRLYDYRLRTRPPIPLLPFTYPPFAALVFLPLSQLPWTAVVVLWQAASVAALGVIAYCTERLLSAGRDRPRMSRVMLWTAGGLWLEPVRHTLDQGQVNLILGALVLAAVAVPRTAAARGTALGAAAAVKLTPAFGGLYLLATRQWRAAAWALTAAGGATVLAWAVAPRESARYWFTLVTETQRIGPSWSVRNQSLRGALGRLLGPDAPVAVAWWTAVALATALAAYALWSAVRHRDPLGILVTAELYGLLVSPVSWSHHWIWCLPSMMWLAHGPGRHRPLVRVTLAAWIVATATRLVPLLIRKEDGLPHPTPYPALLAWPGTAYAACAVLSLLAIAASGRAAPVPPRLQRVRAASGA